MFVRGRVWVTAAGVVEEGALGEQDAIAIYPRMPYAVKQRVISAATRVSTGARRGDARTAVDLGAYNLALLEGNILDWRGPSFVGVPVTAENIRLLDSGEPLVERVLAELAARNAPHQGN